MFGIRSYHLDNPRLQTSGQDLTVFSCVPFSPLPPACVPNTEIDCQKRWRKTEICRTLNRREGVPRPSVYDVHIFGEDGISQLPPDMACTLFLDHDAKIPRLLLAIFCPINFHKLPLFFSSVSTQPSWFLARGVLLPGPAGLPDTRSTTITSIFSRCILFHVDHRLLYLHI